MVKAPHFNCKPILPRFLARIDKENGQIHPIHGRCWKWLGTVHKFGYATFSAMGEQRANRVSWRLFRGSIPDGLFVLHKCDNRECVNPDHLWLGTQKDNIQDAVAKGRMASGDNNGTRKHPETRPRGNNHHAKTQPETICKGEKNGRAKLNEDQVREIRIREKLGGSGNSREELATYYGVSYCTINEIVRRATWKHVK